MFDMSSGSNTKEDKKENGSEEGKSKEGKEAAEDLTQQLPQLTISQETGGTPEDNSAKTSQEPGEEVANKTEGGAGRWKLHGARSTSLASRSTPVRLPPAPSASATTAATIRKTPPSDTLDSGDLIEDNRCGGDSDKKSGPPYDFHRRNARKKTRFAVEVEVMYLAQERDYTVLTGERGREPLAEERDQQERSYKRRFKSPVDKVFYPKGFKPWADLF